MKKIIALSIAVSMAIGLFVSCDIFNLAPPERDNPHDPGGENLSLFLTSAIPAPGSDTAAPDSTISATFSEELDLLQSNPDCFTLMLGDTSVAGNIDVTLTGFEFTADDLLERTASYTGNITAESGFVASGGHTLDADFSWSFSIADWIWGTATELTSPHCENISHYDVPHLVIDGSGNAIAVMQGSWDTATGYAMLAARFSEATETWSDLTLVSTGTSNANSNTLAGNNDGQAMVTWYENYQIWSNRFETSWQGAEQVSDTAEANSDYAAAVSAEGTCAVFWSDNMMTEELENSTLWIRYRPSGGAWESRMEVASSTEMVDFRTRHMVFGTAPNDPAADVMVLWMESNRIKSATCTLGGAVTPTSFLDTNTDESQSISDLQLISTGDSGFAAAWKEDNRIYVTRCTSGGWEIAAAIDSAPETVGDYALQSDSSGNLYMVWLETDASGGESVIFKTWSSSGGWSGPCTVSAQSGFDFSVNGSGDGRLIWPESDGIQDKVRSCAYTPDGGWTEAVWVEDINDGFANNLRIALNDNGNCVAVWIKTDNPDYAFWGNSLK